MKPRSSQADGQFLSIVTRAAFWWERADSHASEPARGALTEETIRAYRDRWQQVVGEGDSRALSRRLRWEGIDPAGFGERFAPPTIGSGGPLPGWARTIRRIITNSRGLRVSTASSSLFDEQDPIPFEHLIEPAVRVARAKLRARWREGSAARAGADPDRLVSPAARRSLERSLLRRLGMLAARPLYVEFCASRPYGLTVLGVLDDTAEALGTAEYFRFIETLSRDGLEGFFEKYPVLARLMATAIGQWVDTTDEFLQRLYADLDALRDFIPAPPSGARAAPAAASIDSGLAVTRIETSLSDTHKGGRTVAVLTMDDGRKVVYKPKGLGLEVAFNSFLEWCNKGDLPLTFRTLRVLDRGTYGWEEYAENAPCPDLEAARRFYRRAGMLLCVLDALRATDCHHGNIVASGEHPLLIDTETLLHPEPNPIDDSTSLPEPDPITRKFLGSVLRMLFLPAWHVSGDGQVAYDISGLGGVGGDTLPNLVPVWRGMNTDTMALHYEVGTMPPERNVVRVDGRALSADEFEPEISAGFVQMYRQFLACRAELLQEGSPLATMRQLPVRFLFRDTNLYMTLLANACAPEFLEDGMRFSIELDHLSRAFLGSRSRPSAWPILGAELRALAQLDIPYFDGTADREALHIGGGATLPHHLRRAGFQEALDRITGLDDGDLAWQLALIRGSFQARVARNVGSGGSLPDVGEPMPITAADMLAEAERLARELEHRAISDAQGEVNWLGLGMVAETERVQLQIIGNALYEGRCGVALFLAALCRVRPSDRVRELVQAALASLRRYNHALGAEIDSDRSGAPPSPGPAAAGGMIYALVRIGEFLGEPGPLEDARRLAAALPPDAVKKDQTFDVLSGAAGAILGLLSLHRATGDQDSLAQACAFGDHLLEHRVSHGGAPRAWLTMGKRPLAGFSHGAAGITYALLRLYQASGDERFRGAAFEGIAYERSVFSPAHGNWPDLRSDGPEVTFPDQWCHGAAGIALARLGCRRVLPEEAFGEEVELALRTTQGTGLTAVDHLCCGNMGRIEALWVGAQQLGRHDWGDTALAAAGRVLARARGTGSYRLFPNLPCDVFNPGFYRGVAGIGYQWLRLARPELPSVLLWE